MVGSDHVSNTDTQEKVVISADEYFAFKTDKLKIEIEEEIKRRSRKTLIIFVLAIPMFIIAISGVTASKIRDAMRYVEISTERAKESQYILEKAIRNLDINTREAESNIDKIQLLKKEILALQLRVEKLEIEQRSTNHGTRLQ